MTGNGMDSLTRTLTAVVKALITIAKGLGRDRRESVDLKKMSDMVDGSVPLSSVWGHREGES